MKLPNIFKKILFLPFGRERGQWFFEQLRKISFVGLNIGRGARVEDSGEDYIFEYIKGKIPSKPLRLFDVGANIGDWSSKILDHFTLDEVEVFCFEPALHPFEELTRKFNHFHLFHFGFGHENTKIPLYSNGPSSGIASLYRRRLDHFGIDFKIEETVDIRTLDDFCFEKKIDSIDFLKLDVEGHELSVLNGAKSLLKNGAIRFIQFEFGGCNIDSRTYFQDFFYLLSGKYRLYRILKNGLHPIPLYHEEEECFITTNYLAELRT